MDNMQNQNNRISFWGNMMRKNNINSYEISEKTNIPEEKVKEIANGNRTLPTERVNEFVKAIHETKKENKKGRRNEALIFFADKNIKDLRLRFNYRTQRDLAKALNVSQYTVSRAEQFGVKILSTSVILKFYNFFKDELNVRVSSPKELRESNKIIKQKEAKTNKSEYKFYKNYFKEHNLRDLLKEKGLKTTDFAELSGISVSTLYKYINGYRKNYTLGLYRKIYNALQLEQNKANEIINNNSKENNIEEVIIEPNEIEIKEPIITVPEITATHITDTHITDTRISKNADLYNQYEDIQEDNHTYDISTSFNPEDLFYYLINNCITKDVVELYKLFDKYFKNN